MMSPRKHLGWLRGATQRMDFHKRSIICHYCRFDDGVSDLNRSPLGMFFYNTRALFFFASALYLVFCLGLMAVLPAELVTYHTICLLWGTWGSGVVLTLVRHRAFKADLKEWAAKRGRTELPSAFDIYFVIDYTLVFIMLMLGRYWDLNIDYFAILLVANMVVYGAYGGEGRGFMLVLTTVPLTVALAVFAYHPHLETNRTSVQGIFDVLFISGPVLGTLFVTVLSVRTISWLRAEEHGITRRRMQILGELEATLTSNSHTLLGDSNVDYGGDSAHYFREKATKALRQLCSGKESFWFNSACLWFVENHHDYGELLVLGPNVNVKWLKRLTILRQHIGQVKAAFHQIDDMSRVRQIIVDSLENAPGDLLELSNFFDLRSDVPSAFVPLTDPVGMWGLLCLYGDNYLNHPDPQDEAFLTTLSYILSDAFLQSRSTYRLSSQTKMDDLFRCESLQEVFIKATRVMKDSLSARGCMIIYRPDPTRDEMRIEAKIGFTDKILESVYVAGRGKTGKCAEEGRSLRYDQAQLHKGDFDDDLFNRLEKAHGSSITSWMAVPIGIRGQNYGVIKVVNRRHRGGWFTEDDQRLGEDLALRLQVIIEKFLHFEKLKDARSEAQTSARQAINLKESAVALALQRQQDLVNMSHQLQGPLYAAVGHLTNITSDKLPRGLSKQLEQLHALIDDALIMSYGVVTISAKEAGQSVAFGEDEIDAPQRLRKLCDRLQMTHQRPISKAITFDYVLEAGFPKLYLDSNVFSCVMYSLVHNALKYAKPGSVVQLECSYERLANRPALKVKSLGHPIDPDEQEAIFEKYRRGRVHSNSRIHHHGVGLGLWVARQLMQAVGGDLRVELSPAHPDLSIFVVLF